MYAITIDARHLLPCTRRGPTLHDPAGGGGQEFRRLWPKRLLSWELDVFATQQVYDPILGLADLLQGDTPIRFDGAGFLDVHTPILIGFGNGSDTEFMIPHRNIHAPSSVVYVNGAVNSAWTMVESTGLILFDAAPADKAIITWKGSRWAKCLFTAEYGEGGEYAQVFSDQAAPEKTLMQGHIYLEEVV